MPLTEFIEEAMQVLESDSDEVLVERAKPLRNNARTPRGPRSSTQFNDMF